MVVLSKMNCKVLDSAQLKKLDKQEKILAHDIHSTGKGKGQINEKQTEMSHFSHNNKFLTTQGEGYIFVICLTFVLIAFLTITHHILRRRCRNQRQPLLKISNIIDIECLRMFNIALLFVSLHSSM